VAQKATKDTFAIENVGGVEVRRKVFAGDMVPEQYEVEGGATEEVEDKNETKVGKDDKSETTSSSEEDESSSSRRSRHSRS